MKIKKPKLFVTILLTIILIALLAVLFVFVQQVTQPMQFPDNISTPSATPEDQKKIVYLSNNLANSDEYNLVMLIRKNFEDNSNLQFKILDSNGMLPVQINNIDNIKINPVDLLIINPIDTDKVPAQIGAVRFPVIYFGMQKQADKGISIRFSDENAAQLIAQHVFSAIYQDSSVVIVGTEKSSSLYQAALNALRRESKAYGTKLQINSYFTNRIETVKIKTEMPDLLNNQSVIILDPLNMDAILQYLNANKYTGDTIVVSQDEEMLSRVLDGSLDAIVYREETVFAKAVYQTSLSVLNGKPTSSKVESYQGLLNIYNINDFLETKKNSTY